MTNLNKIFRNDGFKGKKERHCRKEYGTRKYCEMNRMIEGYFTAVNLALVPDSASMYGVAHSSKWFRKQLRTLEKQYRVNFKRIRRKETAARCFAYGVDGWAAWLCYHRQKYLNPKMIKLIKK